MRISTALLGTATLLLLLPLTVVQAGDTATGLGRELHEAIEHINDFHLPEDPFMPVGVIGERRAKNRVPQTGPGGHAGSTSEPAAHEHGSSPFEYGFDLKPSGSASYQPGPPSASYERGSTRTSSSGSARSVYRDTQSPARPRSYNDPTSRSVSSSQHTARPRWRDDRIRHDAAHQPNEHWDDSELDALSAGREESPFPSYLEGTLGGRDRPSTSSLLWVDKLDPQPKKDVSEKLKEIARINLDFPYRINEFRQLGHRFLSGEKVTEDEKVQLFDLVKKAESHEAVWFQLLELSRDNGQANVGSGMAKGLMVKLDYGRRQAVFWSAIGVNLAYRVRAQVAHKTQMAQNAGMAWDDSSFAYSLSDLQAMASLAWFFIKAGEYKPLYEGASLEELVQLAEAVKRNSWEKEHAWSQQEGV